MAQGRRSFYDLLAKGFPRVTFAAPIVVSLTESRSHYVFALPTQLKRHGEEEANKQSRHWGPSPRTLKPASNELGVRMSGLVSLSQYAMPILLLNMGGEMVYILHQRLRAQNVSVEKEKRVLRDVMLAMFSEAFVEELFKPQAMYSLPSTKQIFEKLAHSSIMRLNSSSMDKLFDLMSMGVKYQLLCCTMPQQYLHVTLNHMQTLRNIIGFDCEPVQTCLEKVEKHLSDRYGFGKFTSGEWLLLKSSVLTFFQGKKIKVSLFLQKKVQSPVDGTLLLSAAGRLPFKTELVGTTRLYENNYLYKTYTQALISNLPSSGGSAGACSVATDIWDENFVQGHNMYSTTSSLFGTDSAASDSATRDMILRKLYSLSSGLPGDGSSSSSGGGGGQSPARASSPGAGPKVVYASQLDRGALSSSSARAESKMNAALFGSSSSSSSSKAVSLIGLLGSGSLTGFDHKTYGASASAAGADDDYGGFINIDIEEIDAAADAKTLDDMLERLDFRDNPRAQAKAGGGGYGQAKAAAKGLAEDDDDDLLSLMDSVK